MSSKTKTTTTKEEVKPALVPKLRFLEFREAEGWTPEPMGEVYSFKGNNSLSRDKLNYVAGSVKNIHYGDIHTKFSTHFDITKELVPFVNNSEEAVVRAENLCAEGDMVFADASEDLEDIGKSIEIVRLNGERVVSGLHTILARRIAERIALGFGGHLFKSGWVRTQIQKEAQGAKVLGISPTRLRNLRLPLPHDKTEQQKIAECLSSVDELMAAQARKVDALKAHKKGLMQQLFPREGETQPHLRFSEFQNDGEWVVKTLDAIAPLQRGFDLPSDEIRPGSVPIVYSNGPKGFHERGMTKGPGLVTGRSGTIGKLHFIEGGNYWPHNTSLWVTSFKGHAPKFVYYLYDSIGFLRFASGSGVPTLNRNDAHSFETSVPPNRAEQERIASCLTSLDALITLETQKLETLKTHKKGLMQQLFPSADSE